MQGRRYAVLVAAGRFPEDPRLFPLACPENDIADLDRVLRDESLGGFAGTNLLANRPHHEVLRTINEVLKKAERDDLVLIYYSGHGKLDEAGHLYLATADTTSTLLESTAVPVSRIRDLLSLSRCTKSVLILDCCFAGAVEKVFLRGSVDDQLKIVSQGRGTYIMTAATGIQTAQEKEGDRNGLFTKHLLNGIRGGAADEDGDGYITVGELYNYVHREVAAESPQEPMKWDLNVRGELIIAKSGASPQQERRSQIRAKLFELADQGLLPDSVLAQALEVLAVRPPELVGALREYDRLLERLSKGEISIGPFIDAWLRVKPAQPEPKPPPEPRRETNKRTDEPQRVTPRSNSFLSLIGAILAAMMPGLAAVVERLRGSAAQPAPWPVPERRTTTPATPPPDPAPQPPADHKTDRPRPPTPANVARPRLASGLGPALIWLVAALTIVIACVGIFAENGFSFTDSYNAVPSGALFGSVVAAIGTVMLWRRRIAKSGFLARAAIALTFCGALLIALVMLQEL